MHSGGKHWRGLGPGVQGEVKEQLGDPGLHMEFSLLILGTILACCVKSGLCCQ